MKIKIPDDLKKIASILQNKGFSCYLVGGAVRNQLLGIEEKDYDLATDAYPEDIIGLFKKVIPTGIKHGTVTILFKGEAYEITTFRLDGEYSDGRRPDTIEFTSNIYEDLKRRDFTINSIAYDILKEELIDPNNGLKDLYNKIIKAIGDPHKRFEEDGLRPLRACRFAAQLNFTIEERTFQAIGNNINKFKSVSKERIYDELVKTMKAEKPSITFNLLLNSGLLAVISDDLVKCKGIVQRERHLFDVFDHMLHTCDNCPAGNNILRFAGLFHDVGKVNARKYKDDGTPTFYNHEIESSKIAVKIMKELKFPNKDIQKIEHLIRNHMFNYESEWTDAAIRRFIARVGVKNIDDLLVLQRADMASMSVTPQRYTLLEEFKMRINQILMNNCAFSIKDLKINGNILINEMHIPSGPIMGTLLEKLLEDVLENPEKNDEDYLKKRVIEIYSASSDEGLKNL
jgi:poly(A) polymerase/tRNA nucleotidyltransferase (CCA-adding enzyme)